MIKEVYKRVLSSIILLPFLIFIVIQGSYLLNIFLSLLFVISLYEWYFLSKDKKFSYFGYLFILISFYSFYLIRNNFNVEIIFFVLLICIATDIGGYTFGKTFKGPKLSRISPNKTYAGVIGGYILSIVFSYFFIINENSILFEIYTLNYLILTLLISTVSQIGDLIISYFKRISNVKDTGKIIPGHGGILDRIDGMIFVFPFFYLLTELDLLQF